MLQTIHHPLIADELTRLRDTSCPSPEFRQRVRRIASLMVPAVTADLQTHVVPCNTPLEITSGANLKRGIILVPVLRAGLAFLDGFLDLIPQTSSTAQLAGGVTTQSRSTNSVQGDVPDMSHIETNVITAGRHLDEPTTTASLPVSQQRFSKAQQSRV